MNFVGVPALGTVLAAIPSPAMCLGPHLLCQKCGCPHPWRMPTQSSGSLFDSTCLLIVRGQVLTFGKHGLLGTMLESTANLSLWSCLSFFSQMILPLRMSGVFTTSSFLDVPRSSPSCGHSCHTILFAVTSYCCCNKWPQIWQLKSETGHLSGTVG